MSVSEVVWTLYFVIFVSFEVFLESLLCADFAKTKLRNLPFHPSGLEMKVP